MTAQMEGATLKTVFLTALQSISTLEKLALEDF